MIENTTLKDNQAVETWQKCLSIIKESISTQSFKTWFEPIIPSKLIGEKLIIQVPSQFFYEWLEDNYVQLLRKALDESIGKNGQLEYSIIVDSGNKKTNQPALAVDAQQKKHNYPKNEAKPPKNPFELQVFKKAQSDNYLNKSYTFTKFVEGDCNRLARAASFAVAQKPSTTSFNPLMIYGGVGLGKTHLVQAIGNYIKTNSEEDKFVLYVSSEKFTAQYINAVRLNDIQDFMAFYMQVDVLIIDDIQFLSRKEKTQETFFHIFNHLHQSGKQIVMTSDRAPKEIEGIEDRLLSRFKWGLTADLSSPDLETRIAIIQNKVLDEGIHLDFEVIEYLAHSIDTNVRELEGVIISLLAQSSLTRQKIDLNAAKRTLNHLIDETNREVNIDLIINEVTDYFDIKITEIKSKSRLRSLVLPRQIAMYLAKNLTEMSLKSIGYHFGGRDHSTVIHAIQTINDLKDTNKEIAEKVNALYLKLKR